MNKTFIPIIALFFIISCSEDKSANESLSLNVNMRSSVTGKVNIDCWERLDKSIAIMTVYVENDTKYNQKITYKTRDENGIIKEILFQNENNKFETYIIYSKTFPENGMSKIMFGYDKKVISSYMKADDAEKLFNELIIKK
jgi:hypothetical protein